MSNEEKWREDFEDDLGGVYGLGRFSRMDDGYEAEKLNILWRGYRVGRQHSEKEIESLKTQLADKDEEFDILIKSRDGWREDCLSSNKTRLELIAEIEELRSEKGLTGIIKASVNFASKNIELQRELEKYKAAYLVLKESNDFTINELNQEKINLHMMKQVDFCNREASKRAALIVGDGE